MSTPVRSCVGCRKRTGTAELLRVVAQDLGKGVELVPDPRRRAPGRGAHLHPTPGCLELALRRRAFARALRVTGGLGSARLESYVQQCGVDRPVPDRGDGPDGGLTAGNPRRRWSSGS